MAKSMKSPPLVIFGLDAGDAECIQRWVQEGYLPTIASIMERGCWGYIGGPELISTHGTWLSCYSGISRSEHGYYYNRQLKPGTYDLQRVTARDAHALPFWSHLRRASRKVAIIDALETYPVTGIEGIQLANWAVQQQFNTPTVPLSAEPPTILGDVQRVVGPPISIEAFKPNGSFSEDLAAYHLLLKRIEQKGRLCRHFLTRNQFDLSVMTFVEAHTGAHRLWDYRPGGVRQTNATREGRELSTGIRNVYQAIDQEIGLTLKQLLAETNVFIVSMYGMKDLYPTTGLIEAFCQQLGYQVLSQGALNPLTLLREIVPPRWRAQLSHFLPLRIQERLQGEQFRTPIDWGKTTAFPLPSLNTSCIRVNLRGREPQGIVESGRQYEELLDRIEADLRQLIDVPSGDPAVETVTRMVTAYRCDPPRDLPDLSIEWKAKPYFMNRVRHPKVELVQTKPWYNRGSYHTFRGFLSAAGPSIAAEGGLGELSLLDLAPTFLYLMGEALPQRLTGHVIDRVIRSEMAVDFR